MPQAPTQTINSIHNMMRNGDYLQASRMIEGLLVTHQNDHSLLLALGQCYQNTGNLSQAEKAYTLCNRHCNKKDIQPRLLLGIVCLQQGKHAQAIAAFTEACKIDKRSVEARVNLALSMFHRGDISAALTQAQKVLKLDRNNAQSHNIIGLCLRPTQPEQAIRSFRKALKLRPDLYDGYHNLADTYVMQQKTEDAIAVLKKATTRFPANQVPALMIGKLYESNNRAEDAIDHYTGMLDAHPDNISVNTSLFRSLCAAQRFKEAEVLLDELMYRHGQHPEVVEELTNHHVMNRNYETAYKLSSAFTNTHSPQATPVGILISLARACRHTGDIDAGIETLNSALLTTRDSNARENLHYHLGDLYDKKEQFDNAFKQYDLANKEQATDSDIIYYQSVIQEIITTFDGKIPDQAPHTDIESERPVFIVGMPRSGTSLIEQIMLSHPAIHGAGEITDLWKIGNDISGAMNLLNYCKNFVKLQTDELTTYAHRYLETIESLSRDASRCTDKLPHNFMHIGLINSLFPKARVVHCRRHPFDTCLSIYFKNFNDNHKYTRKLEQLGMFYQSYLKMMHHWHSVSTVPILDVDYESLILDPEAQIRRLIAFTGLDWDDSCLSHQDSTRIIMTPSHDQASRAIYSDSMYRWKNYEDHLSPLTQILGDPRAHQHEI